MHVRNGIYLFLIYYFKCRIVLVQCDFVYVCPILRLCLINHRSFTANICWKSYCPDSCLECSIVDLCRTHKWHLAYRLGVPYMYFCNCFVQLIKSRPVHKLNRNLQCAMSENVWTTYAAISERCVPWTYLF